MPVLRSELQTHNAVAVAIGGRSASSSRARHPRADTSFAGEYVSKRDVGRCMTSAAERHVAAGTRRDQDRHRSDPTTSRELTAKLVVWSLTAYSR